MNKNVIYRLDDKVIFAMFAVSIFFLALMSFRYKTKEPCTIVDFTYRTTNKFDVAYINETIYFSADFNSKASAWAWDFGDKTTPDTKSGPYVTHQYKEAGQYTLRLTINDKCEQTKTINVSTRTDNKNKLYLLPVWPDEILIAGKQYEFDDNTEGAINWNWYFDDGPKMTQKPPVKHRFLTTGPHKVILVINDDIENNRIEKTFTVNPPSVSPATPIIRNRKTDKKEEIPDNPPAKKEAGPSLDVVVATATKIPTISNDVLKGYVLSINSNGYNELLKYFKKGSFENCIILHNNHSVSVAKLKELIDVQKNYGKTFDVKQEVNPDNNIVQISITATLEPKKRFLIKDKQRGYNYK